MLRNADCGSPQRRLSRRGLLMPALAALRECFWVSGGCSGGVEVGGLQRALSGASQCRRAFVSWHQCSRTFVQRRDSLRRRRYLRVADLLRLLRGLLLRSLRRLGAERSLSLLRLLLRLLRRLESRGGGDSDLPIQGVVPLPPVHRWNRQDLSAQQQRRRALRLCPRLSADARRQTVRLAAMLAVAERTTK